MPVIKQQLMNYYYSDDTGLMIGFTTIPTIYDDAHGFYKKEFEDGLFDSYKKQLTAIFDAANPELFDTAASVLAENESPENRAKRKKKEAKEKDFRDSMYQPRAYYLFGRFDLAILSLVDDFELAHRYFHPYNPISTNSKTDTTAKKSAQAYDHQIITGLNGLFEKESETEKDKNKNRLINKANQTFLSAKRPPALGICQLKLNNSLVIGGGGDMTTNITYFIRQFIAQKIEEKKETVPNLDLDFILVESFGFHELTVVFFSNSFMHTAEIVTSLRESYLEDLFHSIENLQQLDETTNKSIYEMLKQRTLCHAQFQKQKESNNTGDVTDINHNHLFQSTISTFGFDIDIIEKWRNEPEATRKSLFLEGDHISLHPLWFVKPGHAAAFFEHFSRYTTKETDAKQDEISIHFNIGKGDYIMPPNANNAHKDKEENSDDKDDKEKNKLRPEVQFSTIADPIKNSIGAHIYKVKANPFLVFKRKISDLKKFDYAQHFSFDEELHDALIIPRKDIDRLGNQLRQLNMPETLNQRLIRTITNFNVYLTDPILYNSFLELSGFIKHTILSTIEHQYQNRHLDSYRSSVLVKMLHQFCEELEKAHGNRFFNSYRTSDLTEFQPAYIGGIQQILSAYDSAYKALSAPFGEQQIAKSYVYVSGFSGITSSEFSLCLNYFHIFQPSIFLSVAGHESTNFFYKKLLRALEFDKNKADIKKEDSPIDKGLLLFGEAIKDHTITYENLAKYLLQTENMLTKLSHASFPKLEEERGILFPKNNPLYKNWLNENPDYGIFLDLLNSPEIFRYFMVDLVTFYYAFNQDKDLFYTYHWHISMQMPDAYDRLGECNLHYFSSVYLRCALLMEMVSPGYMDEKTHPPTSLLNDYWTDFASAGRVFARKLKALEPFQEWFDFFEKIAQKIMFIATETPIDKENDAVNEQRLDAIRACIEDDAQKMKGQLLQGKVYHYQNYLSKSTDTIKCNKTTYTIKLIYAYLDLIKDNLSNSKQNMLPRKPISGEVDAITKGLHSQVLFDPLGGISLYAPEVRRDYFMYRTTIMRALWDMGQTEKINSFDIKHFALNNADE